jgi:hypothetical protein
MTVHMKTLQWGLLGTARINRALIPPLRSSSRNRLRGVASRRPEAATAYAREWGIEHAYGSYEALLADPAIDVVYLPLPNALHAEWTIRAARSKRPVRSHSPRPRGRGCGGGGGRQGGGRPEAFMYRHHPQTQGSAGSWPGAS